MTRAALSVCPTTARIRLAKPSPRGALPVLGFPTSGLYAVIEGARMSDRSQVEVDRADRQVIERAAAQPGGRHVRRGTLLR